jgi:hypothetical protein
MESQDYPDPWLIALVLWGVGDNLIWRRRLICPLSLGWLAMHASQY